MDRQNGEQAHQNGHVAQENGIEGPRADAFLEKVGTCCLCLRLSACPSLSVGASSLRQQACGGSSLIVKSEHHSRPRPALTGC